MKAKLIVFILATISSFGIYACHQPERPIYRGPGHPDRLCEDVTGLNLTDQYKAGILQQKLVFKEIDPHTLIHKAILENSPEVIRFLLEEGVSVDYPDENGMSPLTIAILNRCNYAVEVLLAHGANVAPAIKWNNMNLLELSMCMKDFRSSLLLLQGGAADALTNIEKSSLLASAIRFSRTDSEWSSIVKLLIDKGADFRSCNSSQSPLYESIFLAQQGDFSLIRVLLQKGADINMLIDNSMTPLDLALTCGGAPGYVPLITFLLENGANVDQELWGQRGAPLHFAVTENRFDLIQLYCSRGANLNKKVSVNGVCHTPLTLALKYNRSEMVQYLLQQGAKA